MINKYNNRAAQIPAMISNQLTKGEKVKRKIVLISILAIVVIAIVFVGISISGKVFLFNRNLIGETTIAEPDNDYYEYVTAFSESQQGDQLAHVGVRVSQKFDGQYQMMFYIAQWQNSISGEEKTHLDSLRLEFSSFASGDTILMSLPEGGPWDPMTFQQTDDGGGVILDIPNLGFLGTGTVRLEFYVRPWQDNVNQLSLDVDFSMHKTGIFKLTKYEGKTHFDINLP